MLTEASRRKLTELEEANRAFRSGKNPEDVKGVVNENITAVEVSPAAVTPEDKFLDEFLADQIEQGMELLATEAKDALALNPKDDEAQYQLLQYEQWKRTKGSPEGLVITKKRKTPSTRLFGVWQRTRDYGWLIKTSREAVVSDIVEVRRKDGTTVPMELTEAVEPNYFRAREI